MTAQRSPEAVKRRNFGRNVLSESSITTGPTCMWSTQPLTERGLHPFDRHSTPESCETERTPSQSHMIPESMDRCVRGIRKWEDMMGNLKPLIAR